MLIGDPEFSLENRLQIQREVVQKAVKATEESHKYNKAWLAQKATADEIKVGDHVILNASKPLTLTVKWDYGYIVTKVNGLVLELLHSETVAELKVHGEKVVLGRPRHGMAGTNVTK